MANQTEAGNWQIGAPGSLKRLEQEAKEAHDRGDYYSWGKIQAEIDRLFLQSDWKPITGCGCTTCKRLRREIERKQNLEAKYGKNGAARIEARR